MTARTLRAHLDVEVIDYDELINAAAANRVWDEIWTILWEAIASLTLIPGCCLEDDEWTIPVAWSSGGQKRKLHNRRIKFSSALPPNWAIDDPRRVEVLRRLKRIAVLLFLKTVRSNGRTLVPLKPSTWVSVCQNVVRAARWSLTNTSGSGSTNTKCPEQSVTLFWHLTPDQMEALKTANRAFSKHAVSRLNSLLAMEAFDDWPASDVAACKQSDNQWPPFSDDFTATLARAAIWFVEELGPDLISCWQQVQTINATPEGFTRTARVRAYRKEWLSTWEGNTMSVGYPFPYHISVRGGEDAGRIKSELSAWPPRRKVQVRGLLHLLQAAHLVILLLCTAARDAEVAELERDCLVPAEDGYLIRGREFKLSEGGDGEARRWPLPKIAVTVVLQQQQLARSIYPDAAKLFVTFRDCGLKDLAQTINSVTAFARAVRLLDGRPLEALCDGNVHPHRFRKTVSRLAALSLVGANQILFDILGHRDPTMTLNYILSDPDIAADVDKVRREAAQLIAKQALQTADDNGGPAAASVKRLAGRIRPDRATVEQEALGLEQAALILSQNGDVLLVRPGVLCTKAFQQSGLCTKRAGQPDIGNCQVNCLHRLEMAAAKADHRQAIRQILARIPSQESMERAFWQGQLVTHLRGFKDLQDEMLAAPDVQAALVGLPETLAAGLGITRRANEKALS